jgi:signal transduction histidine kinase/CheY-like chemotaxis protein
MGLLESALQAVRAAQPRPAFRRYGVAIGVSLLAFLFTLAAAPIFDREVFFAPFLGAVMISAWYGGLIPGLISTAIGLAGTEFFVAVAFRPPGLVRLGIFTGVAVLISSLTNARWKAEQSAWASVRAREMAEEERDRLFAAQQAARNKAEASERRLALLAEVSQRLMSSLDYRVTLARVVQMIVPAQADGCVIYLLEDGGDIQRVAFRHVVAEKEALLRDLDQHYRLEFDAESPPATAFRTGMPQIGRDIASSVWEEVAQDEEHLRLLVALSPRSYMAVPLISRGRVLGAIFLIVTESDLIYSEEDLAFAQHLSRRAAVAIDNARLYREAQQAGQEAEAANRSKDEFLATVSHELRTPLNAILGWAVLLGKGSLSPVTATRATHSIERNARIQRQLIDDLLDLSRITSGRLRLEVREVDAGAVIDAAIDAVRPSAEAKGIVLSRMFEPGIGPVSADPDRLQQIVWNLASNAVKFTERGGRIHMRFAQRDSEVHISVEDSGQGIAADLLPYVFDRFRQGDASPSRRHGGLGLGLAIVRHLVELHGGTVEASSPGPGQGATFTVRLPVLAAGRRAVAPPAPVANDATGPTDADLPLGGIRVLFVDDQAEARAVMRTILEGAGAEVRCVGSVDAALETLDAWEPALLVSDIGMPGEDGFSLLARVRERDAIRGRVLPAVAVTAYARPEDRQRTLAAGFQAHVSKPVEPADFVRQLAALAKRTGKAL